MKKFYLLLLFGLISTFSIAQSTKSLKDYKQDKTTIVKDSTGKVLPAEEWFFKVQSNE